MEMVVDIIVLFLSLLLCFIYRKTKSYISKNTIFMLILLILMFIIVLNTKDLPKLGLRFDNFLPALIPALVFTLLGIVFIFIFSRQPFKIKPALFLPYLSFGIVQQIFFQSVFNQAIYDLTNIKLFSILMTSIFFSLFHIDKKKVLFLFSFVGGVIWSIIFLDFPNIFALGISHAILAYFYYIKMYDQNILRKRLKI